MKLQITIEGSTFEELVENIGKAAEEMNGGKAECATQAPAPAAKGKKAAKAAPAPEPESDPFAAENDEETEEPNPAVTMEEVMKAGAEYAKEHGRDKALRVLKKFGVKIARDLKPAQYADALAAFGG